MRKLSILIPIITLLLCSCRKINLYPVFEDPEETVFLILKDKAYKDSLYNAYIDMRLAADSLFNAGDSLKADSLYRVSEWLDNSVVSILRSVKVIPADSCNVFVHFMYARDTKSLLDIYDCHAFKGRARYGETILSECSFDRYRFLGSPGKDSLDYKYVPMIFPIPWLTKEPYYLEFKIPANNSTSDRTIDFEYSYQIRTLFNKWTGWNHISSIQQEGLKTE